MLSVVLPACAHSTATTSPASTAALSDAYRSVRAGQQASAKAGGYLFCATPSGLDVVTTTPSESSQWADVTRDSAIESTVRDGIHGDPQLRDQAIQVRTQRGEVYLTGHVASDEQALRATKAALGVDGVVFVNVALTSPQSPGPVARMENSNQDCLL
jgi:hypothetical protein